MVAPFVWKREGPEILKMWSRDWDGYAVPPTGGEKGAIQDVQSAMLNENSPTEGLGGNALESTTQTVQAIIHTPVTLELVLAGL